jgi:hypothetical protein
MILFGLVMISYSRDEDACTYSPLRCGAAVQTTGRGMHLRPWLALPLSALFLLAWPAASYASVGIGVQAGPVRLTGAAHPGGRYALPPVYVVNTGTQPESVVIAIERISPGTGRTVPPRWITVSSAPVLLQHAQSARIPLSLTVPTGAASGRYFSDVVARGTAPLSAGGANLGVAAATDLEFSVVPGVVAAGGTGVPGWVLPYVVAVIVAAAAAVVIRRTGIRIRIEHGPARAQAGRRPDDAA